MTKAKRQLGAAMKITSRLAVPVALLQASAVLAQEQTGSQSWKLAPAMPVTSQGRSCDEGLQAAFKPEDLTKVLLIKPFKKGEALVLGDSGPGAALGITARAEPPVAPTDLCLVKLLVGPGNAGPQGAPSTSKGIHIEVFLPSPAEWNNRLLVAGSGGWSGYEGFSSMTKVGLTLFRRLADTPGWVVASSDDGHAGQPFGAGKPILVEGNFAFNPDGTLNKTLLNDFSHRGLHETAVKTKALINAYYGRPVFRSYFSGGSNGGRQGLKSAQAHPEDFDGIASSNPAINWSRFITYSLYPHIVFQQDLKGVLPTGPQLDLVSSAAVSACDTDLTGKHMGYIHDDSACRYDPTKDKSILCISEGGNNGTKACLTRKIALAVNKIWFGQTEDGSVPDPAVSNGFGTKLDTRHKQLWFGVPRGVKLFTARNVGTPLAHSHPDGTPDPFIIGAFQLALEMENPGLGTPDVENASGNGENGWKNLSYADLARAFHRGVELQPAFGHVNADDPDLRKFRDLGHKMILTVGTADQTIPAAGALNYYTRVSEVTAPFPELQKFFRYYSVPGGGHGEIGSMNGLEGVSPPADPPQIDSTKILRKLVDWVEESEAPDNIVIGNSSGAVTRPLCLYPAKLAYRSGDVDKAQSFTCQ
jgi:feruloyl esterase